MSPTHANLLIKFFVLALSTILLTSPLSYGFEQTLQEQKIEGVNLTKTIKFTDFSPTVFKSVTHGLRKKPIAFFSVKVYVGEIILPSAVTWDGSRKTFENSPEAGVIMTFVRDVPAKNIVETFADGLKGNKADMNSPEIKAFLEAVKKLGDVKKNEAFIVVRQQKEENDELLVTIPNRPHELVAGPKGWSQQILRIWSGNPSDNGVRDLQKLFFN